MIRNGFTAVCEICQEEKSGCAKCAILGTNAYSDKEWMFFGAVCAVCRKRAHRMWLHTQHRSRSAGKYGSRE